MRKFLGLALASVLLAGCGSTDNQSVTGAAASGSGLTGRVVSEAGAAQGGVRLVAHERTTNRKTETLSDSDGFYRLNLPPGVYDLGLDREGDTTTATCFYGPVVVASSSEQRELTLRSSSGKTNRHVFGRIYSTVGVPAANRKVNLRSGNLLGASLSDLNPDSASTTTGADGTFEALLNYDREQGLDVELFDAGGNFDEFVDIGKRNKPSYVELISDLPVATNRLRSDESELNLSGPGATAATGGLVQFATSTFTSSGDLWARLSSGLIPVGPTVYNPMTDIVTGIPNDGQDKLWGTLFFASIRVDSNGFWWWKYAVNIAPDRDTHWLFTDQTGDTYSLWIFNSANGGTHKVNYNSSSPNIQKIEYRLTI